METRGSLMAVPTSEIAAATRPAPRSCSKCRRQPRDPQQRWCRDCRTAWRREFRRLARMRRALHSRQLPVTAKRGARAASVAGDVRRAALQAAAATLLDELKPPSQEAILDFAGEGTGAER